MSRLFGHLSQDASSLGIEDQAVKAPHNWGRSFPGCEAFEMFVHFYPRKFSDVFGVCLNPGGGGGT